MSIKPLNEHYSFTASPSVYDEEAMTALELASRTTAKVNETVKAFNELEEGLPAKVESSVQKHIDGGEFDKQIDAYTGQLKQRLTNLETNYTPGATTADAELTDIRVGEDGVTYDTAGDAVRGQFGNITGELKNLKDAGIKPEMTSFIKIIVGTNKFDSDKVQKYKWINDSGEIATIDTLTILSGKIPVNGEKYAVCSYVTSYGEQILCDGIRLAQYRKNGEFISKTSAAVTELNAECAYVQFYLTETYATSYVNIQLELNDTGDFSAFEAYHETQVTDLEDINVIKTDIDIIKSTPVSPDKTTFIEETTGTNKFDPDNVQHYLFIDADGNISSYNEQTTLSSKIATNGEKYAVCSYVTSYGDQSICEGARIAQYDAQGNFISKSNTGLLELNVRCAYVQFYLTATYASVFTNIQLELNDTGDFSAFEAYTLKQVTNLQDINEMKKDVENIKAAFAISDYTAPGQLFAILNDGNHHQIKLLGDSITHGVGGTGFAEDGDAINDTYARNPNGYCWANLFKANLERLFDCTVINNGCLSTRAYYLIENWSTLVNDADDILIVMYGTNDRLDSANTDKLKNYYKQIKEKADAENKYVFFVCCIPSSREIENGERDTYLAQFTMQDVDAALNEVTEGNYVSLYRKTIDFMSFKDFTDIGTELSSDGLHPNDYLHNKMYIWISEAFNVPVSINDVGVTS